MQQAVDRVPDSLRRQVVVLGVTLDPAYDSPAVLRQTVERWGLNREFRLLTGDAVAVQRLVKGLRVGEGTRTGTGLAHPDVVLVFDPLGRPAYRTSGSTWAPEDLAHVVVRLLDGEF
jgi:cytochrome oxidase Cu insertion factor (SCO1/SenC/PrrC family)